MPDLFVLTTDRVRLTWTAPDAAPAVDAADPARRGAALSVRALNGGTVQVLAAGRTAAGASVAAAGGLAEETTYAVLLRSRTGEPVALANADPVLTAGLIGSEAGRVVHGPVRTGASAGRTRFTVSIGGIPHVEVSLTVAPTKATWTEVEAMRADVEHAGAGLALSPRRPARAAASPADGPASPVGWLAALEAAMNRLDATMPAIERRPWTETDRSVGSVRPSALRRASPETRRALLAGATLNDARLPARPPRPTLDTPTHRWLAAAVARALVRLTRLRLDEAARTPTARRATTVAHLDTLVARLSSLARSPVLAGADARRAPAVPPLVLRRRPAYAEAAAVLRDLDRGLDLREGALDVALQSLDVLYETWTALVVVEAAARAVGAEPPARPFGIAVSGADVRLRSGRRHGVRLEGPGGRIEIVRQPLFAGAALLRQRPDLVLTVTPPGGASRRIVLDAKYRRDDRAATVRRYGTPAPPEDALGALHRYRDAIVGPDGRAGWIDEAAALFPSRDDGWRDGRLWTSLEALGVGAVPLLPGRTDAVDAFLRRVLGGGRGAR